MVEKTEELGQDMPMRLDCGHDSYAQSPRCARWEAPTVLSEAVCIALSEVLVKVGSLGRPKKDRMA